MARGSVICHWDDDDYNAPGRVEDQVRRLLQTGKQVTGYNRMRFFDGSGWWEYNGAVRYALGTSLCYWRSWWAQNRFSNVQVGEDNGFVGRAAARNQIETVPAGDLMIATIHADNTSPRNLKTRQWVRLVET